MIQDTFTEKEKAILNKFVSNIDKPVFVLKNLPEVIKGALFSRYSRSAKGVRRLLLDEFLDNVDVVSQGQGEDALRTQKAQDFYDRILDGYGDDSIGELGGAHIACEQISQMAAKVLEDARIGGSPLEKSTRYVYFDKKVDGEYMFYKEPIIMDSEFKEEYLKLMHLLFDTYAEMMEPMIEFIKKQTPQEEGVSDRAYNASIRAKVCDVIRGVLPCATLTNVGIFGNGRFFEYLLTKMLCNELTEIRELAKAMKKELDTLIPSFVRRAEETHRHFIPQKEFTDITRNESRSFVKEGEINNAENVTLVEYDQDAENKAATMILYQYTNKPLTQIKKEVEEMDQARKEELISSVFKHRKNRRHKVPRAFENVKYTFDLLVDFGAYRDLQRHRMLTQERQDFSCLHGYIVPQELKDAGLEEKYVHALEEAKRVYHTLYGKFPREAQYVVPFAYRVRWYFTLTLREVYWLSELRSQPQGHPSYRHVAQEMFRKVSKVHPLLAKGMKFVNLEEVDLGRLGAEKRKDVTAAQNL